MTTIETENEVTTPRAIGSVVRALRTLRGLSVNQLGVAAGLEPANLSRFERGVPGGVHASKHLDLIATRLGTRASVLHAIAEISNNTPDLLEEPHSLARVATELTNLIEMYPQLASKTRSKIWQLLETEQTM